MREQFTGLRAIREQIQPGPSTVEQQADNLEERIRDLEQCLAGNARSTRWQELKVELENKKGELLHTRRRLAGRTPQMESWTWPLPG